MRIAVRPLIARWLLPALSTLCWAACTDTPADMGIVAQVGTARLSLTEVQLSMPMDVTGQDSADYVRRYVDDWVNAQLLYEQGRQNLPNLSQLEALVEEYRSRLIAQSYENELLRERIGEVTDEDCYLFYEQHGADLRLHEPLVQSLWLRMPARSVHLETVRRWLKELCDGNDDNLEELEAFCTLHGIEFDNSLTQWSPLQRLADRLPQPMPSPDPTPRPQEVKDGREYLILYLVRDHRAEGDVQPFDYARADIGKLLVQQRRAAFHDRLLQDLRSEGESSGFVKINLKTEPQ